ADPPYSLARLGTRRQRPRHVRFGRRAADHCDELAPPHAALNSSIALNQIVVGNTASCITADLSAVAAVGSCGAGGLLGPYTAVASRHPAPHRQALRQLRLAEAN